MTTTRSVALLLLLCCWSPAWASVTQVDGAIVPVGNALQGALNTEEGVSPPAANAIDAVKDASLIPEIFLPDLTKNVTIKDIAEGAGFENSFGYYNVGDDVTTAAGMAANLHPILGCGVAVGATVATQHQGAAGGYVTNAEPGNTATVNFATELAAGRYKGGFIAFYLITPEDNPSNNNCGDFKNGTDGNSLLGRIYYTQRDLNNDGDFVHTLVYNSKIVSDRFYFGAEDLFRGGDNDYEDMATQINGLTPPCVPVAETCNNRDDDCNGVIDNNPVDVGDGCQVGIGACNREGATICAAGGNEVCGATPGAPTAEVCDNIDNDCNGVVDNAVTDVGQACTVGVGTCERAGATICSGGFEVCGATPGNPGAEICNALDDDCDGNIDNGFNVGNTCDGVGECGLGVFECASSTTTRCSTDVGGSQDQSTAEGCDGLDNDCDGAVDDSAPGGGAACTVGVGACARTGITICAAGGFVCNATPGSPTGETCDNIDNDCDGATDEDFNVGAACEGVGECGPGALECATATTTRCSTDAGGSASQVQPESCDGLDNDCDSFVDDGLGDLGPCGLSDVGECSDGRLQCSAGAVECVGEVGPTPERCDGLDNDCNGVTDNDPIGQGQPCGSDVGECVAGQQVCSAGTFSCVGEVGASAEVCDNLDNNCDGQIDEPFNVGANCDGIGECGLGFLECRGLSASDCSTNPGGSQDQSTAELCDGLDNDCDGQVDDAAGGVGLSCTVGVGACERTGTTICAAGGATCNAAAGLPSAELCDGIDNDCDGQVDEDFNIGAACDGIGACGVGVRECKDLNSAQCSTDAGGSASQVQPEICDGEDNDCDGSIDDGLNDLGPCGLSDVGECVDGRFRCSVGQIECVGEVGPSQEFCDGLDNDCDGVTDNAPVDEGDVCGANVGECTEGATVCIQDPGDADGDGLLAELECAGATLPGSELCDGLDNDCDGVSDNNLLDPALGVSCGDATGECDPGQTACLGGQVICLGGNGPQNEVCDGLDNNCDGLVDNNPQDIGQPCGSAFGVCTPGVTICQADPADADGDGVLGELVCDGGTTGSGELCNGADDDCDGFIDDDPSDDGGACGGGLFNEHPSICRRGVEVCTAGALACAGAIGPSVEICDLLDNDCDGLVDEEEGAGEPPLCGQGTECVQGACRLPCDSKNQQCAGGEFCLDEDDDGEGFCVPDPCIENLVVCDEPRFCDQRDGECKLACEIVGCPNGFFCAEDGDCKEDNCYGRGCPDEGQICLDAECVVDPCTSVTCGAGEFCAQGECRPSCESVSCAPQEKCVDGACTANLCFGVQCELGSECVPETGLCSNLCLNRDCGDGRVCDPGTGACVDDPCTAVECSENAVCNDGQCFSAQGQPGFVTGGGAGCAVAPGEDGSGVAYLFLAALSAVLIWRRRALLLGLLALLSGCILDPFFNVGGQPCVPTNGGIESCDGTDNDCDGAVDDNCVGCQITNGGLEVCDGIDNDCDGTADDNCQGGVCQITNGGVERCDEVDNDCDQQVDEDFDLDTDRRNCGECGNVCFFDGAFANCEEGQCVFAGCAPGNFDLDNNPADCEYECVVTNGGVESCDNLDNDCDGQIDEDFDLDGDANNCGACGNVCAFFQAEPSCEQGACTFDPATDCRVLVDPGTGDELQFHDVDGDPNTGCEYACNPNPADANPADPEVDCNGLDDDCDGLRDDGLNLNVDPNNCGGCGRVCSFPNVSAPSCDTGVCGFNPSTDCDAGTHDIDGNPVNGCEYPCVASNGGVEVCDGLDNDCDGAVDEAAEVDANDPSIGVDCGAPNVGTCQAGATVCVAGAPRCVGAVGPRIELCDGLDNDCDGTADEVADLRDIGRVCSQAIGECSLGLTVCDAGVLACEQQVGPAQEFCDGLDNDCDGVVDGTDTNGDGVSDLDPVDTNQNCGGGTVNGGLSQCEEGVSACIQGVLECLGSVEPSTELCDGLDNNCDGVVDDNPAQAGQACGTNLGECSQGTFACVAGALDCQGDTGPSAELCDGLDNDCDGLPDNAISATNDPRIGASCGATDVGACALGANICSGGAVVCSGAVNPIAESCDGIDSDCDGLTDEDAAGASLSQQCYDGPPGTQGVGQCQGGTRTCATGTFAGAACAGQVLPGAELCDGIDNDCDGQIDEVADLQDVGQVCAQAVGECSFGLTACQAGALVCDQPVGPAQEVCDGLDNDCDGTVDDSPSDVGQSCGGGAVNGGQSQCAVGATVCSAGTLQCLGSVNPSGEICDGVDNDCDGTVDDSPAQVGQVCGSSLGECNQGTFACVAGALDCQGDTGPAPESCNGLDDDCSGIPDDNLSAASDPRLGVACGATATGSCELGVQICSGGAIACQGAIGPTSEGCDGLDNDCDGLQDENAVGAPLSQQCYTGPNGTQGVGQCQAGLSSCSNGAFSASCAGEVLPATETCDNLDNDCDGARDEANGGGPLTQSCYSGPGGTLGVGVCAAGVSTCSNGSFGSCTGEVLPSAEICGNALNDDCDANASDASEGCLSAQGASDFRVDSLAVGGTNSTAGQHHSIEPSIARSGNNVYLAFADNRNGFRIVVARSTDSGATFQTSTIQLGGATATVPRIVATGSFVAVAFTQIRGNQTRDLFVSVSSNNGAAFSTPTRLDADNDTDDAFNFDLAALAGSNGQIRLGVVWEELNTGNLNRNIRVRRSKNAAVASPSFDAVQTANKGAGNPIAGRPKVTIGNNSRIVMAWREQRSGAGFNGTTDIFSNFWNDADNNVSGTDRRIDVDTGNDEDDLPVIATLNGQIYVAWEDVKADGADISFARSTDNGSTFGSTVVLDDPSGEVSSSLNPTITAKTVSGQNRVYVGWQDDRDGTEIFVARSINGGSSFEGALRASSLVNPDPGVSLDPELSIDGNNVVAVTFSSNRNGLEDIFVGFSLDAGVTWQPIDVRADSDTAGAGASLLPVIAGLANGFGVAWVDFRTNGINGDIFFRRVTP